MTATAETQSFTESEALIDDSTSSSHCSGSSRSTEDENNESVWDLFPALYLPFILLWLRRSMFGTANLIRSILLGQCLRFFMMNYLDNMPDWLAPFVEDTKAVPPALTVLALLTIVALIVHPDGLTWYFLGKFVDGLKTVWKCIISCWAMLLDDYGIFTTICAVMTLVSIGAILALLLKNARKAPKRASSQPNPPKQRKQKSKSKKWKRRPHHHQPRPIPEHEPALIREEKIISQISEPAGKETEQSEKHVQQNTKQRDVQYQEVSKAIETTKEAVNLIEKTEKKSNFSPERSEPPVCPTKGHPIEIDDISCDSTSVKSFASAPTAVTIGSNSTSSSVKKRNNNRRKKNSKRATKPITDSPVKAMQDQQQLRSGENSCQQQQQQQQTGKSHSKFSRGGHQKNSRQSNNNRANNHNDNHQRSSGRFSNLKQQDNNRRHGRKDRYHNNSQNNNSSKSLLPQTQPHKEESSFFSSPPSSPYTCRSQYNQISIGIQFGGDTPGKMKLASFLRQIGMSGYDGLLANVPDLESLSNVTPLEYQLYGVSAENQALIRERLAEEKRRMIRPPPGLGLNPQPQPFVPSLEKQSATTSFAQPEYRPYNQFSTPLASTQIPFNQTTSFNPAPLDSETNFNHLNHISSSAPITNQTSQYPDQPNHLFSQTGKNQYQSFNAMQYDQYNVGSQLQYNTSNNSSVSKKHFDDTESRIEAELQELGGQMVGSILDF